MEFDRDRIRRLEHQVALMRGAEDRALKAERERDEALKDREAERVRVVRECELADKYKRERDEALKRQKRLIQAGNLMATSIERAWARNAKEKAREWRELCAALEGEE